MKILIDNGHGRDTAGKCSPDGLLQEWRYTREVAQRIVTTLHLHGHDAEMLCPEVSDTPLAERVRRVNHWCSRFGSTQVLLISLHLNAAGSGAEWKKATGWEAYTSPGDTAADDLCELLYRHAEARLTALHHIPMRRDQSDGDSDKEARFYILQKTFCPAVLTENLFMDSPRDYAYLLSEGGKQDIVNLHVAAILDYLTIHH